MQVKIDELDALRADIAGLTTVVTHLVKTVGVKKTVDVKDIADMEGVSVTSVRNNCRYLLPDYGESQYPDGPARWDLEKYLAWRSISPKQRKLAYRQSVMARHQKEENRLSGANA